MDNRALYRCLPVRVGLLALMGVEGQPRRYRGSHNCKASERGVFGNWYPDEMLALGPPLRFLQLAFITNERRILNGFDTGTSARQLRQTSGERLGLEATGL